VTTAEAIAERTGIRADALAYVLEDELARGRVRRVGGGWSIVPQAFAPGTIDALRALALTG
jgi:hypothetical protein